MRCAFGLGLLVAAAAFAQLRRPAIPVERPDTEGAIAGRVCEDVDRNGACSAGEPGVPGARVVLETGQQAVTDARGRYHLAAVGARAFDSFARGSLRPGRHRLRLDTRRLPRGTVAQPEVAVVEVPMGGLVVQDFALVTATERPRELTSGKGPNPPRGEVAGTRRVRFLVGGRASPGDRVTVAGAAAEIDGEGRYTAWVELLPGRNELPIAAVSRGGAVRYAVQRIDVVERQGSFLVIPRAIEPTASVQLPVGEGEHAATGATTLKVSAAPGTRVTHSDGEVVVGEDGAAAVPVELSSGENRVELRIERPGQSARVEQLVIHAAARPFVVGLIDLETHFRPDAPVGKLKLIGRGGAHLEHRIGRWHLVGELELRDRDWDDLTGAGPGALAGPRRPDRLERALDPETFISEWADDSYSEVPNAAEGRVRLELSRDGIGAIGVGTHRALFSDAEVGRYARAFFGPYLEVSAGEGAWQGGASAFFAPGVADPVRELSLEPAHEELVATGGSVYYLGHFAVAQGSEIVRVELRDGLTGVPIAERHLQRGRDYEIDYASGRILLARPLSFAAGDLPLPSEALTAMPEQVLVVDYEHVRLAADARGLAGGELSGRVGPVEVSAGAVQERGRSPFALYRASARASLGPVMLLAEAARSEGVALPPEGFGISDDGGLTFARPGAAVAGGDALTVRARGPGLAERGFFDVAFRRRTRGFSDGAHFDAVGLRQLSLRGEQRFGPVVVGALADDRTAADPRAPFSDASVSARILGGSVGWQNVVFGARLDVRDTTLTAAEEMGADALTGGRTSVGVSGHWQAHERVRILAGHKQVLAVRGEGLGAFDDSFSSLGVDVRVDSNTTAGIRGGWGPRLGPQVWGQAEVKGGRDVWYGNYSVDVDGPSFGERRVVTGARTDAKDGAQVFVEDVASHDAAAIRLSRAVGLTQEVAGGFIVSGRYELGVRHPLSVSADLSRQTGGVTASWVQKKARAFARLEARAERGRLPMTGVDVDRVQRVLGIGGEVELLDNLRGFMRANLVDTRNGGVLEASWIEGSAALAWRFDRAMLVLRYSIERELPPLSRGDYVVRSLEVISVLPSVNLGERLSLSAGAHAARSTVNGNAALVLSASLRPAVKVVGGLELAAEVARRSSAPDDGELTAARGELGYRFNEHWLLAAGYTLFGFSGTGVGTDPVDEGNRFYLRAELGY